MLRNILRDNAAIVDRTGEENIDHFITWLKKQPNPDFLDFLGVLSYCEGRSMPQNQKMIMQKLLAANQEREILLSTDLEGNELKAKGGGSKNWVPLKDFLKKEEVYSNLPPLYLISPSHIAHLRSSNFSEVSCPCSPASALGEMQRTLKLCPKSLFPSSRLLLLYRIPVSLEAYELLIVIFFSMLTLMSTTTRQC